MKFPAYWARATAEEVDGFGKPARFSCWRWSDTSQEDAHASALAAARRLLAKVIAGEKLDRYGYGQRPLREEVKQRIAGADGRVIAVITQNGYGSLVLNTAGVMFVDIDFPEASAGQDLGYLFKKLLGKKPASPGQIVQQQALEKVRAFVEANRPWSARLYRTHSGLRVLATHELFDPAGQPAAHVFQSLAADPLYVRLCREQECFRARLTPKPWRCGQRKPFVPWPHASDEDQRRFQAWHAEYLDAQADYGTCRFLAALGDGRMHPEAQQIVELHDSLSRAGEELELA